jgi:iron complex outermembrane receptor protein
MAEMKNDNQLAMAMRKATLYFALSLLGLMLLGNPVLAQDDSTSEESATSSDEFMLEDIVVTGSVLRTSGMDTPTPVTVVDLEQIELLSPTTVIEGLAQLPQFAGSTTTQFTGGFFQTTGAGTLNLRSLQGKRTLQLLNGRRMVQSTIFGGPDVNLFPADLLASVETVTGGASAAYGTNAVAGVVNWILDTRYEGLRVRAQYGETDRGHNDNYKYAVTGGFRLADKTHVVFSFEKERQDPIWNKLSEYGWYDGSGLVDNPDPNAGESPDNPFYIKATWMQSLAGSTGGILHFPDSAGGNYVFVAPGEAIPMETGSPCSYFNGMAAFPFGCSTADGGYRDDNTFDQQISPDSGRENYFGYIEHEFNDNLMAFGQVLYGKADFTDRNFGGLFINPPLGFLDRKFTVYSGNPFLPADMQQIMDDNGLSSVEFSRFGSREDIDFAYTTQNTETLSITAGIEYEVDSGFFEGWRVKSYYQNGETDVEAIQKGGIRLDRIFLAADVVIDPATGQPACNVTVTSRDAGNPIYQDCVPLNLFGEGAASAEAVDWVTGFEPGVTINANGFLTDTESIPYTYTSSENKQRIINIQQKIFDVTADGEIYEGWGAGPINMGIGYTYRQEEFVQVVEIGPGGNINMDPRYRPVMADDPALGIRGVPGGNAASGNSVEIQFSNVPYARGDQDVHEAFTEILVPLIAKKPLIEQLNFSGAARWADYSGSGTNWSWKTGLDWAIFDQLRLRGTISQDVRAATMGEKFDRTGGLGNITDWFIDPDGDDSYSITTFSNGSPDIQPEEGKTHTIGVVYQPDWLEGFGLTMDYYKIKITDNINQLTAEEVVDRCYQTGELCDQIIRGNVPATTSTGETINRVSLVGRPYFNQNALMAKGIDFEVNYHRDVDWFGGDESVGLRLYLNNRIERSDISEDGTKDERQGEFGLPKWQGILTGNYRRGPFGFFAQAKYTGETLMNEDWNFNGESERWDVADNTVDSTILVDARVNYIFEVFGGFLDLYANVNNVFDKDPEEYWAGQYTTWFATTPGLGHTGDLRGRRWVIGARFEYEL